MLLLREPLNYTQSPRLSALKRAIRDVTTTPPADMDYEIFRFLLLTFRNDRERYFTWSLLRNVYPRHMDIILNWMETGQFEEFPYGKDELSVVAENEENWWWNVGQVQFGQRRRDFEDALDMIGEDTVPTDDDGDPFRGINLG